jgi:hypothetical protein
MGPPRPQDLTQNNKDPNPTLPRASIKPCMRQHAVDDGVLQCASMQWPAIAFNTTTVFSNYHHYFLQLLRHACHDFIKVSLARLCGLRFTLIEDCRWAIEDWLLLGVLVIEGMLLSGLVVRLVVVKRRSLS